MNENNEIEKNFDEELNKLKITVNLFEVEIEHFLNAAKDNLSKAVDISEKYGLPISYAGISFLSNNYLPESWSKWSEEQKELLEELDVYPPQYDGWQHSDVC